MPQCGLHVIVPIGRSIASGMVAHFEIENVGVGPVHEWMGVPRAGPEARAHARRKRCLALVRDPIVTNAFDPGWQHMQPETAHKFFLRQSLQTFAAIVIGAHRKGHLFGVEAADTLNADVSSR